jgi:hypothetical protein
MMNVDPLFGFVAAWMALGLLNTGYALASGRRERGWLTVALTAGPLATSLLLVLSRGVQRVR